MKEEETEQRIKKKSVIFTREGQTFWAKKDLTVSRMTISISRGLEAKQFKSGLWGGLKRREKAEGVRNWKGQDKEKRRNKKSRSEDSNVTLKVVFTQDVTFFKRFPLQVTLFLHVSTSSPKSTAGHKDTFASWILAWLVTTGICYLALLSLSLKKQKLHWFIVMQ